MIIEKKDVFEIDTRELVVRSCRADLASVQVELESPQKTWTLNIEGSFSLIDGGVETAQVGDLVGRSVLSLRAHKADGQLDLEFDRDSVLTVYPDPQYESWQMHSTHGDLLISVAGGGVAVWRAET